MCSRKRGSREPSAEFRATVLHFLPRGRKSERLLHRYSPSLNSLSAIVYPKFLCQFCALLILQLSDIE